MVEMSDSYWEHLTVELMDHLSVAMMAEYLAKQTEYCLVD
jgi:hypothetical protein